MATIMHYPPSSENNSRGSYKDKIDYAMKEIKTDQELVYGKDLLGNTKEEFVQEFREVKKDWDKLDGRQYYHIVQSFEKEEYVTPEKAHEIGIRWAEENKALEGYQVVVATHVDRDHCHNHFVINSVNFDTGKKFGYNQMDMLHGKELSNEICLEYGFKTIELDRNLEIKQHEPRFSLKELAVIEKGEISWKDTMRESLKLAEERTIKYCVDNNIRDRQEVFEKFKEELNQERIEITRGFNENNKTITFEDNEGNKCRGDKLDLYYKNRFNIANNMEQKLEQELEIKRQELDQQKAQQRELELKRQQEIARQNELKLAINKEIERSENIEAEALESINRYKGLSVNELEDLIERNNSREGLLSTAISEAKSSYESSSTLENKLALLEATNDYYELGFLTNGLIELSDYKIEQQQEREKQQQLAREEQERLAIERAKAEKLRKKQEIERQKIEQKQEKENKLIQVWERTQSKQVADLDDKKQKLKKEIKTLKKEISKSLSNVKDKKIGIDNLDYTHKSLVNQENRELNKLKLEDMQVKVPFRDKFNKEKVQELKQDALRSARLKIIGRYKKPILEAKQSYDRAVKEYNKIAISHNQLNARYRDLVEEREDVKNELQKIKLQTKPSQEFRNYYNELMNQRTQDPKQEREPVKEISSCTETQEQQIDYRYSYENCLEMIEEYRDSIKYEYEWYQNTELEKRVNEYRQNLLEYTREVNPEAYERLNKDIKKELNIKLDQDLGPKL